MLRTLLLTMFAGLLAGGPKPSATAVSMTAVLAADSTLTITGQTWLSGALQKPDSIRWTLYRNSSTADSLLVARKGVSTMESFTGITPPLPGDSATYILYTRVYRDQIASGKFKGDTTLYVRPAPPLPPPPVVDSVSINPVRLSLAYGDSIVFLVRAR